MSVARVATICDIEERWAKGVVNDRVYRLLEKFHHIVLGLSGTCDAPARIINRSIIHLPFGIDMDRLCRYPNRHSEVLMSTRWGATRLKRIMSCANEQTARALCIVVNLTDRVSTAVLLSSNE